jgi:hypothetical protein
VGRFAGSSDGDPSCIDIGPGEAAKFYEEKLGLGRAGSEDDEVIVFDSGDTKINAY